MSDPFDMAAEVANVHPLRLGQKNTQKIADVPEGIEVTEDGVARAFTETYGETMRFDHSVGKWFEWSGDHWAKCQTDAAIDYCRRLSREASEGLGGGAKSARKAAFASGVERFARTDRIHATTQDKWDSNPFLAGCPDGEINLKSGQIFQPEPSNGITKRLGCKPAREDDCPRWKAFLSDATQGDDEVIRFLAQWCGYCLTGDTREHTLLFIYGGGGNGKSVFLNVLTELLGDYATAASMDTFTASRSSQHPTDLASLRGARMVSASETDAGKPWAEARIKAITGGDKIAARFMRQDFFEFSPEFKLVIVGNHQPTLHNVDEAARRRFRIVPFIHKPVNPDRELQAKLSEELPGILRWALNGLADWLENGLVTPASVVEATEAYFNDQDAIGQWLEESCRVELENTHLWATRKDLFESWSNFAKRTGEEPKNSKWLVPALRARGLTEGKRSGVRGFKGVQINQMVNSYVD